MKFLSTFWGHMRVELFQCEKDEEISRIWHWLEAARLIESVDMDTI